MQGNKCSRLTTKGCRFVSSSKHGYSDFDAFNIPIILRDHVYLERDSNRGFLDLGVNRIKKASLTQAKVVMIVVQSHEVDRNKNNSSCINPTQRYDI